MKTIKVNTLTKGILLAAAGIIFGFFPGVVDRLFYIVGMLILVYSAVRLIMCIIAGRVLGIFIAGIIGGIVIIALPKLLPVGLSLIAAVIFLSSGFERFTTALSSKKSGSAWIFRAAMGVLMIVCGGFLIFNPYSISGAVRKIIGIVLIIIGVINIVADLKTGSSSTPDIIDVTDYSVRDDNNKLLK